MTVRLSHKGITKMSDDLKDNAAVDSRVVAVRLGYRDPFNDMDCKMADERNGWARDRNIEMLVSRGLPYVTILPKT